MILVTFLTSSKLDFLIESVKSFFNQKEIDFNNFFPLIVVNTTNDEYYIKVSEHFSNKISVVRTKSNGRPGMGHNSLIDIFTDSTNFDYLIPIDGDDMFYPYALKRITTYLNYNPDILFLPFNDIIGNDYPGNTLSVPINGQIYLNYNNFVNSMREQWYSGKINPFTNKIDACNTPGRLILLSRKSLEVGIKYDENLKWYDDFIVFLKSFETFNLRKDYNIFMLEDMEIYLYNRLNEESVSDKFKINYEDNVISERFNFEKSIKNNFLSIRSWDLKKIVFLKLDDEDNFKVKDKIEYVENIIKSLDKSKSIKENEMNYENLLHFKKYAEENSLGEMIDIYNILVNKYTHSIV